MKQVSFRVSKIKPLHINHLVLFSVTNRIIIWSVTVREFVAALSGVAPFPPKCVTCLAVLFRREMVNAWFAERVHTIPVCKEGARGHAESCSCPSQQSARAEGSAPGTPARKISASEFDRPLRPIVVKDSEGTVSFLSDSEKKEQMPLTPPRFANDEGDQCSRLLELVKDISSHLDVTALCHKIFLHIHGLISADRYSLFLVCEDSSNDKFLVSRLFDVAEGSTLEEASNNCIRLEWNKGIVGHVAALGEPLNIKDAYEVSPGKPG